MHKIWFPVSGFGSERAAYPTQVVVGGHERLLGAVILVDVSQVEGLYFRQETLAVAQNSTVEIECTKQCCLVFI